MNGLKLQLYPGELPYSGIARLIDHHLLSQSAAFNAIFQRAQRGLGFHFTTGLTEMSKIFIDETVDTLLTSHTLFPLFARFKTPAERELMSQVLRVPGPGFQFIKAKSLKPFEFSFCPECAGADTKLFGETYWHREHQIPFVTVCAIHKCFLETWAPPVEKLATRTIFSAKSVSLGTGRRAGVNTKMLDLANAMIGGLVECDNDLPNLLSIAQKKRFVTTLSGKNFISNDVWAGFTNYCTGFDGPIERGRVETTLMLSGAWKGTNPALYYLLWQYLNSLPDYQEPTVPAFPCVNSICSCAGQTVSTKVSKVRLQYRKKDGFEVECNQCGMIYRRRSSKPGDKNIIVRYGYLIKAETIKSQNRGETFKELSQRLGVNARVLSRIHEGKMTVLRVEKKSIDQVLLQTRRNAWSAELKSRQFKSLKLSSVRLKTEYRWLMNNDKKWITQLNARYRKRDFTWRKADFNQLDKQTVRLLKSLRRGLIAEGTERRITKTLLKALLPDRCRVKMNALPLSNKYLSKVVEDISDFKIRAIKKELATHERGYHLTKSRLYEEFNLKALNRQERQRIYDKFIP